MTTNLWKMTREQHGEVRIMLNFESYSEVFTARELLSDGIFTIEELQACCELDGGDYTPKPAEGIDVVSMCLITQEEDSENDEYEIEYMQNWRKEIAREAGAMYGMQSYHDHMGYDFNAGGGDGNCSYCGGNGWTCC